MEKEKQIEEMAKVLCSLIKDGIRKDCEKCYFKHDGYRRTCKFRKCAIKLYKAGYGNVKEAVKEAEHRAKVAERALELCETAYILALNGKQHEGISQQAIVSDLGVHKFFIEQAEKELSEEQI